MAMAGRITELEQEVELAEHEVGQLRRRLNHREEGMRRSQAALAAQRAKVARTLAFWSGRGSLLTGDGITEDTLLHIASFLPTARDLCCLQLSNKRFAARCIAAPGVSAWWGAGAAAPAEMLCIPEEVGRLWAVERSEQERGWVPRRGRPSWLCRMHDEVEGLQLPLAFGRAHADITLSMGGALATNDAGIGWRTAASSVVMRSGRHFAQLRQLRVVEEVFFGVMRPDWELDVEGGEDVVDEDGHCFYGTDDGLRDPGGHDWEGRQAAQEQGDRIGMLLDLDQGSMTVWKNDEKLGVMQAEGLSGPLCWAVELLIEGSVRIMSAPAPASPTEEELAAAMAWQAANAGSDSEDE